MKKLLAMVLALVMTLSLAVSASAVKADEKINEDYAEAVAVLNGMGVFKGYEDGSFKPENNITRAEVATIIYRIYTGDVAKNDKSGLYASYNKFTDMAGAGWAAGYIGYCSNAELVKGYPNGTFQPSGNITGYEVLAMILRAVGYDKNGEFTGADWALNVAKYAEQLKILDNVAKTTNLGAPATRELVAEILFRAINVPMVTYTAAFGYQNVGLNGDKDNKLFKNNVTLGKKNFDLKKDDKTADKFGRPTITWTYNTGDEETVIAVKPLATFTEPAKNCEVYDESGLAKDTKLDVYTNSKDKDGTYVIADNKDDSKQAMQGRLTEVYEDRLVNVDTYLAVIEKAVAEKTDAKGHVTKAYVLVDEIYGFEGKFEAKFVTSDEFKADDMVLVTVADGKIQSMVKADAKNAVLTGALGNSKVRIEIQEVTDLDKDEVKVNHTADYQPVDMMNLGKTYNFYFDTYGNVIGAEELSTNYAVLDKIYAKTDDNGDTAGYADLYFFEGESKAKVTVDEIYNPENGQTYDASRLEENAKRNPEYYKTVYAYEIDKDGVYTLDCSGFKSATTAAYENGNKYIEISKNDETDRLQLSKDSKILLQTEESPNGTFEQFAGYEKLPSFNGTHVQYVKDANGYVDMIYIYATKVNTRTVFFYDVEGYKIKWNDGKPYTTLEALELVDDELKEVKIDLYIPDGETENAIADGLTVGLYDITMSTDNVWNVTRKYVALGIAKPVEDGMRIYAYDAVNGGPVLQFDLDKATAVVKYDGTPTKGEVDTKNWTANDLTEDSIVYVQIDETKHKTDYTYDALVVYDMYVKVPVYVNTKETEDVEYLYKDFNDVTVTLKEYEMIDTAKMSAGQYVKNLDITYYDLDGKEIKDFDAVKGTKVSKAVISCTDKVYAPIAITTAKQAAADKNLLIEGPYAVAGNEQGVVIDNEKDEDGYRYINVVTDTEEQSFTVANLRNALKQAQKCNFQKVEFFNTDLETPVENEKDPVASDMIVKVTSWDGSKTALYRVLVNA